LELSCGSGGSNFMSAAGKMLYEALCMNSVNQSIGRSIRHAGDYASILLLDKRYKQERVIKQLPSWIQSSYCAGSTLNDVAASLKDFYGRKKS
jgi:chromosome transmission fidelity protein 1